MPTNAFNESGGRPMALQGNDHFFAYRIVACFRNAAMASLFKAGASDQSSSLRPQVQDSGVEAVKELIGVQNACRRNT